SFEGPEKRLEVIMRVVDGTHVSGLLAHDDDVWQKVIDAICAHIVSREFNEYIRSYVLSE
nr:Chain B, S-adenosylmethionine decarboxylase proenzyme [Trypanosoma brucei brucei TREU927]